MNHHEAWGQLEGLLDGSLPARERWGVVAHLAECQPCRDELAAQARFRGVVRDQVAAVEPPPGLTNRLRTSLAAETALNPQRRFSWQPVMARAAVLLVPLLLGIVLLMQVLLPARTMEAATQGDLGSAHALFARDDSLFDVTGNGAAVQRWFHEEAGLQVNTPAIPGFTVVGGRLITVAGKAVGQVIYEDASKEMYLSYVRVPTHGVPGLIDPFGRELNASTSGTITTVSWPDGADQVAMIAAMPPEKLTALCESLLRAKGGWEKGN